MAAIDDLITQIEDNALRDRIREEVDRLTKDKKFGLVFEEHLPELTPIYTAPVCVGSHVARREASLIDVWRVLSVSDKSALCINQSNHEKRELGIDDLVVVRRLGEPIFPVLTPMKRLQNSPPSSPWHALIEADNYHALQLLEYLYSGQVDCIYIDPPYNTGARDWTYNNDYVDANDRWRHSKWLAMMNRRLKIAVRLLREGGVICITIDDYEHHHLRTLISSQLRNLNYLGTVVVRTSPSGRPSTRGFRVNHEYAIFYGKGEGTTIGRLPLSEGQQEFYSEVDEAGEYAWQNLRKRGGENTFRKARPKQYFPLYVKEGEFRVPNMKWLRSAREWQVLEEPAEGETVIYPVGDDGRERIWSLSPQKILDGTEQFEVRSDPTGSYSVWRKIRPNPEGSLPSTWWDSNEYSIVLHGATELERILNRNDRPFPFPKSPFSVLDALRVAGANDRDALIVDFFAGSGTTLQAVNMLNVADGGRRRCILVTNNEVSEDEAKRLLMDGYRPGDPEWEQNGICRSVTWPRSKYTILGQRNDGSALDGEYLTGGTINKEKSRTIRRLGFIQSEAMSTAARKREIISLIEGIPISHIKPDTAYFVSNNARHTGAILFDDSQADAFLESLGELDEANHITHLYIVTKSAKLFRKLKTQLDEMLGPIELQEPERRPMSEGFPANLEYFRMQFLEKDHVALGQQFRAILPLLWLRAGAVGPRPELTENDEFPTMLIPPHNPFAVLIEETCFANFQIDLAARDDVTHVFLVTDSEDAFQEMAAQLMTPNVIQLYRDYLDNFAINRGNLR